MEFQVKFTPCKWPILFEKIDLTVLFAYLLNVSILNDLVWIFEKRLYETTSTLFFSNSKSLERPGLIIETLEYVNKGYTLLNIYLIMIFLSIPFNRLPLWLYDLCDFCHCDKTKSCDLEFGIGQLAVCINFYIKQKDISQVL